MAIKPEGGGGKALMARPLRQELFLWLPLLQPEKIPTESDLFMCVNDERSTVSKLHFFQGIEFRFFPLQLL